MTRWKIVPLTPTRDMVARTVDAVFGGAVEDPAVIEEVYGAMLAAAPESPDGPIFNAAARAHAEALLNDPQAARAFLERANIVGPDGQLVPELRSDGDALEQLRERAELVAGNPRGDGTMRVAAADILALLNRANAADEARPVAVADVRHGVLVRSSLPVGYTGPLFAAPPHPAVEARIDPMQNPLRPTLAKLGPSGEHPAEEVLRKLACWLGVGGYNAPTVDAELFHRKIVDGIESLRATPPQPAVEARPALLMSDERVRQYVADYVLDADSGVHQPTEGERLMLYDAISGLTAEEADPPQPAAESRSEPAAEVRDGVLVRSSLPVGYTGPLYAAPPQPETAVVGPRLTEPELRRLWVRMWGVQDDVPLPSGTLHVNLVQFAEAVEDAVRERIANGGTHGR